jgi:hypothetical protein
MAPLSDFDRHTRLQCNKPCPIQPVAHRLERGADLGFITSQGNQSWSAGCQKPTRSLRQAFTYEYDNGFLGPSTDRRNLSRDEKERMICVGIDQKRPSTEAPDGKRTNRLTGIQQALLRTRRPVGAVTLRNLIIKPNNQIGTAHEFLRLNALGRLIGIHNQNLTTDMDAERGIAEPGDFHSGPFQSQNSVVEPIGRFRPVQRVKRD